MTSAAVLIVKAKVHRELEAEHREKAQQLEAEARKILSAKALKEAIA